MSKKHLIDLKAQLSSKQPSLHDAPLPSDPQAMQYQLAVTDKTYMKSSLDPSQLQRYYNKKITLINAHHKHNQTFKHRNALRQASLEIVKTEHTPSH